MELGQDFGKLGCKLCGERVHKTVGRNSIKKENQMETIILALMIFSLIVVISIDTNQKRRKFMDESN
jgi:hypothetical protein